MPKTILIIDDDSFSRRVVNRILTDSGYEVHEATNGQEGLDKVDAVNPDLIVLDVMMPDMNGYEVCRRLREREGYANLPVLMLTAGDAVSQKIKGFEAGADDYMTKPFHSEELEARVGALIRRAEAISGRVEEASVAQPKILALFSLRGGVGCTTMATNLALGLHELWSQSTVLVDLALTCGQAALMMDQSLRTTWKDLAPIPLEDYDAQVLDKVLLSHESGLRILAAPTSSEDAEMITEKSVSHVLTLLKESYDYIVLDLGHDFKGTTLAGLDSADEILLLFPPDVLSVYAAKRALATFEALDYDLDIVTTVLNWTFKRHGVARGDIEKVLGRPVDYVFPFVSEPLVQAINRGEPPVINQSNRPLGALFEDMAFYVSREEDQERTPASPTRAWRRVKKRQERREKEA
jgi:pilus assembly protein CpaE